MGYCWLLQSCGQACGCPEPLTAPLTPEVVRGIEAEVLLRGGVGHAPGLGGGGQLRRGRRAEGRLLGAAAALFS